MCKRRQLSSSSWLLSALRFVPPQQAHITVVAATSQRGALLHDSPDLLPVVPFNPEELLADAERRRKIKKAAESLSVPSVKRVCSSAAGLAQWLHTIDARMPPSSEPRHYALTPAAARTGHKLHGYIAPETPALGTLAPLWAWRPAVESLGR